SAIDYLLDAVDLILVMTVNPGFGGQTYIEATTDKIRRVRRMIGDRPIELEVDGGITPGTIAVPAAAGANIFVAGSAVYKGTGLADYRANIDALRRAAEATRG
ncbi:MAG: ribulose-phosphate 3-epimerase, partial [Rhizobiaceae bacterium]|nr:ribulose-phosphate 3-epimerase [Rhizobiaceae bacterium]